MNEETSYQNQDLNNVNPFQPRVTTPEVEKKAKKFAIPNDPKIKLLIILSGIVAILLVLSLIVTVVRNSKPKISSQAIPTSTPIPQPTDIPDNTSVPQDLFTKFDEVNKNTQVNINFDPPQIDTTVGL